MKAARRNQEVGCEQFSFRVQLIPSDVVKILRDFIKEIKAESDWKITGQGAYVFSREDFDILFSKKSVAHHFSPAMNSKISNWCFDCAIKNQLILKVSKLVAEAEGHLDGEGYILNERNIM